MTGLRVVRSAHASRTGAGDKDTETQEGDASDTYGALRGTISDRSVRTFGPQAPATQITRPSLEACSYKDSQ